LSAYNIAVDGKEYKIKVERKTPFYFTVNINENIYNVQIPEGKEFRNTSVLRIGDKEFNVKMDEIEKTKIFSVTVNGVAFKVELEPRKLPVMPFAKMKTAELPSTQVTLSKASLRKPVTRVVAEESAVVAPMTGKIVEVKVKVNDKVKEGDIVCILEAMKMENEIAAPISGVIREVYVSKGSSVSEGDILMVIE